jgi:hypothetical protein
MTRRPDGWLEVPEIENTPPPSPPRVPIEDILQEVPEEGQQEEEDAFDDASSVDAAAMATEVLRVLEGAVATPAASSTPPLAIRRSKRQLSSDKDYAALAGIKRRGGRRGRKRPWKRASGQHIAGWEQDQTIRLDVAAGKVERRPTARTICWGFTVERRLNHV